jgi:hypothetical protein
MAIQYITHHGFRYCADDLGKGKWSDKAINIIDWLLLISVAGLTAFLVISFSIL